MGGADARAGGEVVVRIALVSRLLLVGLVLIAGLGLLAEVMHHGPAGAAWDEATPLLSLSYEGNLPTWYASSLLLCCAAALGFVAAAAFEARDPLRRHWAALALLFVYLSIDEAIEIHELLNELIEAGGALYFSWIIPASLIVVALGAAFVPFLRALPAATRRRFLVAGLIYVGGALVMEVPLGLYTEAHGDETLGYAFIDLVEETLELTGASLFLLAILRHAAAHHPAARITS